MYFIDHTAFIASETSCFYAPDDGREFFHVLGKFFSSIIASCVKTKLNSKVILFLNLKYFLNTGCFNYSSYSRAPGINGCGHTTELNHDLAT